MELPPCFPKVNGKATCWKIGEEEKKIGIRFRGFCTHSTNGYCVSLGDIKISAVIFLSGLEMCVKNVSPQTLGLNTKYVVQHKFAPFTSQGTSEGTGEWEAEITSISNSPFNQ